MTKSGKISHIVPKQSGTKHLCATGAETGALETTRSNSVQTAQPSESAHKSYIDT